jgi:uncharacterized protein involved in exopolysaccharide biosynthesis
MIANRQLGMDDYVAMWRRRRWLILVPLMLAPVIGYLVSYSETPKYTSYSLLFVESQAVPANYVRPFTVQTTSDRMISLEQQVLSRDRLQTLVRRLGVVRKGKSEEEIVDWIRNTVLVIAADPNQPPPDPSRAHPPAPKADRNPSAFIVSFTADQPRDAQQVCLEVSSALIREDFEASEQVTQNTAELLDRQLEAAKQNLDQLDHNLAGFKKLHIGHLPSDVDNNVRILDSLHSRLDWSTQTVHHAQQDKVFLESLLAQEEENRKQALGSPEVASLQNQLVALQDTLITMQIRYTSNHPEVTKVRADIAEVKAKLKAAQAGAGQNTDLVDSKLKDSPAFMRLREQIQQDQDLIASQTAQQGRFSKTIDDSEKNLAVSPDIEEKYKQLTRDNETARGVYADLLAKKSEAEMQAELQNRQEAQQMRMLYPPNLPTSPNFPVRWKFAAAGLAAGLALGFGLAVLLEMRDQSLRNEGDIVAGLNEQMLGSVPWTVEAAARPRRLFRDRLRPFLTGKRTAEA